MNPGEVALASAVRRFRCGRPRVRSGRCCSCSRSCARLMLSPGAPTSHQRSRQHPQRHSNGRPARPTPPGLAGNARAPAVRALRRAAALRVSVHRLIVVFAIVQAPSFSYPLRLCMLCSPSCAFRRCARCGHTRFKTRGGSARLRPPIDCCVHDRAGSHPLVPAPVVNALLAIVRRAMQPYALQDARRLYASSSAD